MAVFQRMWAAMNQNDPDYMVQAGVEQSARQRRLALWIGLIALGLGPAMLVFDWINDPGCLRPSISAYYYDPLAGRWLTALLVVVAVFLFTYRGESRLDGALASCGSLMAFVVAVFPTVPDALYCHGAGGAVASIDMRPGLDFAVQTTMAGQGLFLAAGDVVGLQLVQADLFDATSNVIHTGAAVILLLILLYFSAVAFRRTRAWDKAGPLSHEKQERNRWYTISSIGMALGLVLAIYGMLGFGKGLPLAPVFAGEALALFFFGVSWMIKGRFFRRKLTHADLMPVASPGQR